MSEPCELRCPKCGYRTFHAFIDPQSGLFGRCSRTVCGYVEDMEDTDESGY